MEEEVSLSSRRFPCVMRPHFARMVLVMLESRYGPWSWLALLHVGQTGILFGRGCPFNYSPLMQ